MDRQEMSPELAASIADSLREGVSVSLGRRGVSAVHWSPGDPNRLAEIIIQYVRETPVDLTLDGHRYLIHRVAS